MAEDSSSSETGKQAQKKPASVWSFILWCVVAYVGWKLFFAFPPVRDALRAAVGVVARPAASTAPPQFDPATARPIVPGGEIDRFLNEAPKK